MSKKRQWTKEDYGIIIYLAKFGTFGLDVVYEDLCLILEVPTTSKRLESELSVFKDLNLRQDVETTELQKKSFESLKNKTTVQLRETVNLYIKSNSDLLLKKNNKIQNAEANKNVRELNDILLMNFENELAMKSMNRRLRKITK